MAPTIPLSADQTTPNSVGSSVVTKDDAIRCLNAAIDASAIPRKVIYEDFCGISKGYFSAVVNGKEGDFIGLVYKLPADIRKDFTERLAELERVDPLDLAAEQLALAALRFLRMRKGRALPIKLRMARASSEPEVERKRA